jgi:hypothetical protein
MKLREHPLMSNSESTKSERSLFSPTQTRVEAFIAYEEKTETFTLTLQ